MTVTTPAPRTRAVRRVARSHALAAAGAWLMSALLVVSLPLVASPAAADSPSGPRSTAVVPEPDAVAGQTVFTLSPVGRGTVRPGESLAVSVTLQNGTDAATIPFAVTLSLGGTPLADRASLAAWLGGDTSGVAVAPVGTAALSALAAGAADTQGIVVAPDDPALAGRAAGVYPLIATYDSPEGPVSSTSAMIVPADPATPVGIGVLVPITADATTSGLLTAQRLSELTSPSGSLTNQLDAVEGTAAILAVDPAIAAAIRVLGTSAPPEATEWLARLEALPNSRFALQFGDADVAVQLAAGLGRPEQPSSLQVYMQPANFIPTAPATPTPTSTPSATSGTAEPTADPEVDPSAPVYPTLPELLDIGGERAGVYWPATGTATPSVVAGLGALTTDDRTSLTLLPSTATVAGAGGATVPAYATAGEADVLVYDDAVSAALRDASAIDEASLRGAPLTEAAAYLSFAAAETGGAPLLVTIDRDPNRSAVAMSTAIATAQQAAGVTPLTLGGVAATLPVGVEIAAAEPDAERAATASALFSDEAAIGRFATILDDVTLLTGPQRAEVLQLLGIAWLDDSRLDVAPVATDADAEATADPVVVLSWSTAVANHRSRTATTLDSVGILPPGTVNLFSAGAPLPVWVRNDLPYPANVVLYATPDDLRLDVQEETVTTVGPQSNTRVQVPVQARVGSGQVNVDLQLRSRTYEPIGATQVTEVNVRADWESIGIVVLSVLIGAFVILGLIRTVLRVRARRRARDTDAEPHEADAPESDGETDAAATGLDGAPR